MSTCFYDLKKNVDIHYYIILYCIYKNAVYQFLLLQDLTMSLKTNKFCGFCLCYTGKSDIGNSYS